MSRNVNNVGKEQKVGLSPFVKTVRNGDLPAGLCPGLDRTDEKEHKREQKGAEKEHKRSVSDRKGGLKALR